MAQRTRADVDNDVPSRATRAAVSPARASLRRRKDRDARPPQDAGRKRGMECMKHLHCLGGLRIQKKAETTLPGQCKAAGVSRTPGRCFRQCIAPRKGYTSRVLLAEKKTALFTAWGTVKASVTPCTVWGSSVCPRQRARVKGRKDPAVLLRSMAALLHLEAGAEDRPAATVRQVMGTASHKADDGGPEGRHDAMPTDTAEPALTGGRCRIGPDLIPLAGREQVTPPGGGTELFAGHHAELAIMAGSQGHNAEKLAIGAAFALCGAGRCGKIRGSKKTPCRLSDLPPPPPSIGGFFITHWHPPVRH